MNNKVYSIEEIRRIIEPAAKSYGLERVSLFGSYARGEAAPDSDIDLIISEGKSKSLFKLGGIYEDFGGLFGKKVDIVSYSNNLSEKMNENIRKDEIVLYVG